VTVKAARVYRSKAVMTVRPDPDMLVAPYRCPGLEDIPTPIDCYLCGAMCPWKEDSLHRVLVYFRLHPEKKPRWWPW